jgi:Raf kinase inhibitor-like YbhB/YbcL family protein
MRGPLVACAAVAALAGCGGQAEQAAPSGPAASRTITVSSPAFADGAAIPATYTCRGAGTAPEVRWSGAPKDAGSLAVVVDDPDAPDGDYVHWIVVDIPVDVGVLDGPQLPGAAKQLPASGGPGWTAPCPPSGKHHYRFTVYALPSNQTVPASGASPTDLVSLIARKATAWGRLTGTVSAG